ncbi:glutathionylspermidine synthase family protein [Neoroseomonas soli]|uniref:Glutathionylspermidine synthase family protein n=1 Tax=Neoroseomonas soli TaxID=1081025 RepID=A0A9X9WTG2_9PROT|nr:glutathionylspermidine synthase family protein [Neoroseomonas soli]MBR0670441.1 glutathionylspermidine synthase family protein [Neoroseomonas soli]
MAHPPFRREPVQTPSLFLARLRELGLDVPNPDGEPWWVTDAAYVIDAAASEALLEAAKGVQKRCYQAVEELVASGDYAYFGIHNPAMRDAIGQSWRDKDAPLHGRMDFSFAPDGTPMLTDYEADSPFGLAEASFVQWEWFESWQSVSGQSGDSQENLLYEKLSEHIPQIGLPARFAIACGGATEPDGRPADTTERFDAEYLAEIAAKTNRAARICSIGQVGWDLDAQRFTDDRDEPHDAMIKIYPWDWMEDEPNVEVLPRSRTRIYPGAWVRLLADKTMMALLWHMFPGAPNLLPTFLDRPPQGEMVAKPRRGWDGEHVYLPGQPIGTVPEDEVGPLLYQAHCPLPVFPSARGQVHCAASVWMVGGQPAGLSFRESRGPVTGPTARFVPHILRG